MGNGEIISWMHNVHYFQPDCDILFVVEIVVVSVVNSGSTANVSTAATATTPSNTPTAASTSTAAPEPATTLIKRALVSTTNWQSWCSNWRRLHQ